MAEKKEDTKKKAKTAKKAVSKKAGKDTRKVKKTTAKKSAHSKKKESAKIKKAESRKVDKAAGKKSGRVRKEKKKKTAAKRSVKDTEQIEKSESKEVAKIEEEEKDTEALNRGDSPMSVVGHLDELRSRALVSILTIIIITLASFFFSEYFLDIINRPYLSTGLKLNVFNLTEGFLIRLKASLIAGILLGLPVIVYELWRYIHPAIEKKDRKFIGLSVVAAVFLFYSGILFTYFFILPFAVKMLLSFTPEEMTNTIGASKYLSFVMLFSLGMAIMFELPIVILILTRIGIVTPQLLVRKRKYAVVLIWVIAAMITPPDVLTQLMLGMPIMLLYEVSILISKLVVKRKKKKELQEEMESSS